MDRENCCLIILVIVTYSKLTILKIVISWVLFLSLIISDNNIIFLILADYQCHELIDYFIYSSIALTYCTGENDFHNCKASRVLIQHAISNISSSSWKSSYPILKLIGRRDVNFIRIYLVKAWVMLTLQNLLSIREPGEYAPQILMNASRYAILY